MALREFARLTDRLLAHLGEEAVLRWGYPNSTLVKAAIEHGVEFADANDQAIFERSIATIGKEYLPEVGDRLRVLSGGDFILDRLVRDNGYSRAFIIRGAD